MLLRRVIEHVKAQNWTAVGIDFFIVVVGVFVGLQVSNWNDDRNDLIQEQNYLSRLHAEVIEAEASTAPAVTFRSAVQETLDGFLELLETGADTTRLSGQACTSIFFSHMYEDPFLTLPSIAELLGSGQLSILQDDDLRHLLATHAQRLEGSDRLIRGLQGDRVVMTSRHPDQIQLKPKIYDFFEDEIAFFASEIEDMAACDFNAMRNNPAFRNDIIDNTSRHGAYVDAFQLQFEHLQNIHIALDRVLRIDHEDS